MSRMKKKWLRGGASLALVAALSLSSVMPVWAADPAISDDNTSRTSTLSKSSDNSFDTGVEVTVDNNTTYTITLPKTITLTDCSKGGENTFSYSVACDLAPTQKLDLSVANVALKNKNGKGGYTHTLTAALDPTGLSFGNTVEGTLSKYQEAEAYTGKLTNPDDIRAGHWAGIMVVTAELTQELDLR